jgi:hypothetical protein
LLELRSFQEADSDAVRALHDEALEDAGVHGGRGPWEGDLRDIRTVYLETGRRRSGRFVFIDFAKAL